MKHLHLLFFLLFFMPPVLSAQMVNDIPVKDLKENFILFQVAEPDSRGNYRRDCYEVKVILNSRQVFKLTDRSGRAKCYHRKDFDETHLKGVMKKGLIAQIFSDFYDWGYEPFGNFEDQFSGLTNDAFWLKRR